jgi:hypothetical protein
VEASSSTFPDAHEYCREVEAYLCRKNDGHLIRIVGPAFDQVCAWAREGIPLKVVYHGIDRYFDRYYARGQRRRWPVRIEFCGTDVLDVFDDWRRAVGVSLAGADAQPADSGLRPAAKPGLQKHLDRVVDRLSRLRAGQPADSELGKALDRALDDVEEVRAAARRLRGEARARLLARLREVERDLMQAATGSLGPAALARIDDEADRELAPFRGRMHDEAYREAVARSVERLIRLEAGLPQIRID